MAFDKATRNRLASFVGKARDLIADEFTQQFQSLYGISDKGTITPVDQLGHLDDMGLAIAALLRERIDYLIKTNPNDRDGLNAAVARLAREQAFTVLNRLAAIRMAEKRGIIVESVGKGYQSKGFKVFEQVAGVGLGDTYQRYCRYLYCLFDELAVDLGILFDRRSPQGLLFPRETALQALLALLNALELDPLWAEDETIGWIYQYYNDPAERKKMRDESAAPRNSRELAVRNQFFTPRYVVEFLTDNTLGRIWYEMTQGETSLKESCRYLVRRPDEVFFHDKCSPADSAAKRWLTGEAVNVPEANELAYTVDGYSRHSPIEAASDWLFKNIARVSGGDTETFKTQELLDLLFLLHRADHFSEGTLSHYATEIKRIIEALGKRRITPDAEGLSQEELLKLVVYIPYRGIKDPRELRMLDPACGSMHFGLYAFDLLAVIYEEAWELELESLRRDYPEKNVFLREIPRLIIEHNIHGIDIDPRAVQIAGLSLWLRAQKSWQLQRVPASQRPRIIRSNIVCAEAMPGSPEMLAEFAATLHPPLLGQLVEKVFAQMQLAGEAGSLLKIEEDIATLVKNAKKLWQAGPKVEQAELNLGLAAKPKQGELPLDVSGISDERFWETVEERIYAALHVYAEQAENGGSYQRRLFAEDAAHGFAFADLCRKRYDVVLMNPPFGEPIKATSAYLSQHYVSSKHDLFAAFCDRSLRVLNPLGLLGEISSRVGFFIRSFEEWRNNLLNNWQIQLIADLGSQVLDNAAVEAACYVISHPRDHNHVMLVYRLLVEAEKAEKLLSAIRDFDSRNFFVLTPYQCRILPLHPFIYWVPATTLRKFTCFETVEPSAGVVRQGLGTGDNFRFIRTLWEVPVESIAGGGCSTPFDVRQQLSFDKIWAMHVRSGASQPWYSPLTVVIDWEAQGQKLKEHWRAKGESPSRYIPSEELYFRPGLSWTLRAFRLIPYIVPTGCIPSASRYMAFPYDEHRIDLLGFTASVVATAFMRFYGEAFERPKHLVDTFKRLPFAPLDALTREKIRILVKGEISKRKEVYGNHEPFSDFILPALEAKEGNVERSEWNLRTLLGDSLDHAIGTAMGLSAEELELLLRDLNEAIQIRLRGQKADDDAFTEEDNSDDIGETDVDTTPRGNVTAIVSYSFGCAFGRWDIRFATGERQPPELSDPFAPLPICPPGMLQNINGLPAEHEDVPVNYPLRISWHGILVDDENHPEDIVARAEDALKIIWKDGWEAIEQDACKLLGAKTLRDYFRRPAGFFADHLKRYSKSRRQAPIYWPLSTAKGSYTLWTYYHRLTDQTLHTALADYVDPKLKSIHAEISTLRESGNHRNRLEELLDLEKELSDFHDEIEVIIKLPWKPNLNDGVLITAAPLWKLFRLPKWQKDLKACWGKLEKGEYDWAHLAYNIWPDRVENVCKKDRSIAIAHNLEHLCQVTPPKVKRGKKGG